MAAENNTDKIALLRQEVNSVVDTMKLNINKMIDRGDRLEDLEARTDELRRLGDDFGKNSRRLNRAMWWKNMKLTLMIASCCIVILAIIIIAAVLSTKHS